LAETGQTGTTPTSPETKPTEGETAWIPPEDIGPVSPDIAKLLQAAETGDARSQFLVGARYAEGNGVAKDERRAAGWFRRAGQQGLAVAQYRLGTMYERGRGVTKDPVEAKAWYERAAKVGNRKSMHNLAVMSAESSDYAQASRWFRAAAELGLKDSQYNLAILVEKGLGTKASQIDAYAWYAAAAAQGDNDAKKRMQAIEKRLIPRDLAAAKLKVNEFKAKPVKREANELPAR
jgi:localization factor PodJL